MKFIKTAERVSEDISDNYVFQRSLLAYEEASKHISGKVLEIGTGSGYGVKIISPKSEEFITIDKYKLPDSIQKNIIGENHVQFIQMSVPPFKDIPNNTFDYVITFQVIEHIEEDMRFIKEIYRVLKNNGKLIVTTPNKKMSLTRNPWHVREYNPFDLEKMILEVFQKVECLGVFGNDLIMEYYQKNKKSVEKITRYDIFNLQYNLPRWLLQIPYDILNRINRKKLLKKHTNLTSKITMNDYFIKPVDDRCFDLFYIAEKSL